MPPLFGCAVVVDPAGIRVGMLLMIMTTMMTMMMTVIDDDNNVSANSQLGGWLRVAILVHVVVSGS